MPNNFVSLTPKDVFLPFGKYSHGILNKNTGLLVTSGQLGIKKDGSIPKSFKEQTEVCFSNILSILKVANYNLEHVIKISSFLTSRKNFKDYMVVRDKLFFGLSIKPASTLLIVSGFTKSEFLVEIEVIAQK